MKLDRHYLIEQYVIWYINCAPYTLMRTTLPVSNLSLFYTHTLMNNTAAIPTDIRKLRGLSFGSLNVRSLTRKIDEIKFLLGDTDLTVLTLNETWLNFSISDCELEIPHYQCFRFDRDLGSGKRGGGGLVTYAHTKYNFECKIDWNLCCPDMEWQWSILRLPRTRKTYICNLYRPPDGNIDIALNLLESKLNDIYTEGVSDVLIMGDMNIDLMTKRHPNSKKLLALLKSCALTQLICCPTRITETTATLLDHIICNRDDMYYQWGTYDPGISDHCLTYVARKKKKLPKDGTRVSCRNYNKLDVLSFQHDIDNTDWSDVLMSEDPNTAAGLFTEKFIEICNKHAPMRTITMKDHAPAWVTNDYLAHRDERKHHCKTFNKHPTPENKLLKDKSINRCNELRLSLQRSYFQEAIRRNPGNMKKIWQEIKKFWPHLNKSSIKPVDHSGTATNEDLANLFNDFFSSIGMNLQERIPNTHETYTPPFAYLPVFEFSEFDLLSITTTLRDLSPSSSCGTDGITSHLLKLGGPTIIPAIHHICNLSVRKKIFPNIWKIGRITPLHKSGDNSDPSNFRPISILPCLGKVLEKLIHQQLYAYLDSNDLLSKTTIRLS